MPLVHIAGKLVQFAHVPRSGGSAVENYLSARFGPLAFLDRQYFKLTEDARWSATSPQHLEEAAFARLFPEGWIAQRFAMVRHPEDRIVSVFRYQRDLERCIPADTVFEAWIADLSDRRAADPHLLDNHPRPACDLVHEDATVFRLEDGMDAVIAWLDRVEGAPRAPRAIVAENGYLDRLAEAGRKPGPPPQVTPPARAAINDLYAMDFNRFGYLPRGDARDDPAPSDVLQQKDISP